MAPPPNLNDQTTTETLTLSSSCSSSNFFTVVTTVAVAQTCLAIGYSSAEPAALRSLSRVADAYLRTLARSAAASANSRGRTEANALDVVRAVEDLSLARGFAGASDPSRPLLRSSVIKDLVAFVGSVEEVPFPKPIRRRKEEPGVRVSIPAVLEEKGRGTHIPKWLPEFPDWKGEEKKRGREKERLRWEEQIELGLGFGSSEESAIRVSTVKPCFSKYLSEERRRVRFKLGLGLASRKGENTTERRFLLEDGSNEDDDDKNGTSTKPVLLDIVYDTVQAFGEHEQWIY
ncbi:putative transcription initiation factor TFIID subunit 8 [Iris pallida]|uniref:Transcription initiation factor TFIID subunit 8 n=1 Tax=Iris pallida TaxID=29817 RepID=A0AAX6F2H5_IRIPA|nr:putative transcription initiation factor TFIID subunit 8 [Iris pallida]